MNFLILLFLTFLKRNLCFEDQKPMIHELLVSSKLVEGKKFFLTCQLYSGAQPVSFNWYHFDELVKPNEKIAIINSDESSQLIIKEMAFNNSGSYTCKATNSFGTDSRKVDLKLMVRPKWTKLEPSDISVKLNSDLQISCEAYGYPEPKTKLERLLNGNVIETYDTGRLNVKYTKDYSGQYRCVSENIVSKIEKEFRVKHYGIV